MNFIYLERHVNYRGVKILVLLTNSNKCAAMLIAMKIKIFGRKKGGGFKFIFAYLIIFSYYIVIRLALRVISEW